MKSIVIFLAAVLSFSAFGQTKTYECAEHGFSLIIDSGGFEHVNHRPLINGEVIISELVDAMWFIEEVSCTSLGFKIIASHIQYNDPDRKTFNIVVHSESAYEIR